MSLSLIYYEAIPAKLFEVSRKGYTLNKRQIKVLNKVLDVGIAEFEGEASTKKYAIITKTSIPTVKRGISKLIAYELFRQVNGSAGWNIRYVVV